MKTFPSAKVALDLLLSGEKQFFIDNEIQVASYLSECFDLNDASLLPLCVHFSRFAVYEEGVFAFSEVADIIIEEYLDPELYLDEALHLISDDLQLRICSPLWHLLARSSYRTSQKFRSDLVRCFQIEPCYMAEVMERTEDVDYLPILEEKLRSLAPFIKYMPRLDDSHETFWEHDFWARGGTSYIRLLEHDGVSTEHLPMDYLQILFLDRLPDDPDEWFEQASNELKVTFKKRFQEYSSYNLRRSKTIF